MSSSSNSTEGSAQAQAGISLVALLTALASSAVIFGVQILAFILLKNKLARIFKPKTYLVPERERTDPPPRSPWGWLFAIFHFTDREVINKCGLDAYFFLRYLQTLLVIFVPLAFVIIPILVPLNAIGGRGPEYALEFGNSTNSADANVTGLDQLAWTNIRPTKTNRYWAHLVLALLVIIWVCGVFFAELKVYIKVRQDYLTSAEHRLRASATTVLVSAIPQKWLTTEALGGLYDVFPGGIRNIWINRNFDELLHKIHERDHVFQKLEAAETELIRKAKKAQRKQAAKDEKEATKRSKLKPLTKQEKEQKIENENKIAEKLAQSGGTSTGDPHQVPHTVDEALEEERARARAQDSQQEPQQRQGKFRIPIVGDGLAAVGQGLGQGLGAMGQGLGKAGGTVFGGARTVGKDFNNQLETTNGFINIDRQSIAEGDLYDEFGRYRGPDATAPYGSGIEPANFEKMSPRSPSVSSEVQRANSQDNKLPGNTVRKTAYPLGGDATADAFTQHVWWKFWQAPSGGFASPLPTGYEDGDEFPLTRKDGGKTISEASAKNGHEKTSFWAKIKSALPFFGSEDKPPQEYPIAYNPEYKEDSGTAVWQKYLKKNDRPTHRLARFSWTPGFLPGLPLISKKVDTIYWCRGELARLNLEIEMDQKHPERFPLMNSAFIQFNHQVAAHMACQAVTHHVPKHMAPRTVEISPNDVLWDNMSIKWWEAWLRTAVIVGVVVGMVILWTIPVAWTASLAQITSLSSKYHWLKWLDNIPQNLLKALAGVLPALVLSILLALVPALLGYLSFIQGSQTGVEKQGYVQTYYFFFLFVQVFLVVSVSGGIVEFLGATAANVTSIPETLAGQLPKSANYFFTYMILQAMSTSSGTLLQIITLILWFVMPKLFDNTARQKWTRNTTLPTVTWGSYFPVYTNFACIGLIYCVVSPIIIIFAIITFALLWIANRYNMLYVSRFKLDTGGLLYPRAINQTFTGLYVMEICLIGLFLLARDEQNHPLIPQAIIMIVAALLTILYQVLLNVSFGPLLRHLPITFEDEAVIRDEVFERAQARRLGIEDADEATALTHDGAGIAGPGYIEMSNRNNAAPTHDRKFAKFNPVNIAQGAGSWAVRSGRTFRSKALGHNPGNGGGIDSTQPLQLRAKRKRRDIEAQQKIANALYGDYNDEIEDLTPEERDTLVKHAFQHYALRARRPTVWIPRDDIGVSDDEIRRTRDFAGRNIWISNVGAALDAKSRVVYGRNPPDFSEVDLINL
ncbi:hypothetical protein B7494_g4529 [Chlorociboria aeruginascens]|nr:hypothetical protein B7494_g4529 [Chlorociboria aeruginascens]